MISLPTSIRIGYRDYRIELMSPELAGAKQRFAEIDHEKAVMRIECDLDPPKMANSVLHELLHACWYVSGIGPERKKQERVVSALSNQFTQVWRDNPELVAWISQQLQQNEVIPLALRREASD